MQRSENPIFLCGLCRIYAVLRSIYTVSTSKNYAFYAVSSPEFKFADVYQASTMMNSDVYDFMLLPVPGIPAYDS